MFITHPRPKKNALVAPPRKKRKAAFAVEEILFDETARADYLTGFHKRKVQRQKEAQEIAAEKARQEKIAMRKERQRDVEEHVRQVNEALRNARRAGGEDVTDEEEEEEEDGDNDEEWDGIRDPSPPPPPPAFVDHEEEYIDEDKYTTVMVEAVDIDRDGMHALSGRTSDSEGDDGEGGGEGDGHKEGGGGGPDKEEGGGGPDKEEGGRKKTWPKKTAKKKFRYESKTERQAAKRKQKQSARRKG